MAFFVGKSFALYLSIIDVNADNDDRINLEPVQDIAHDSLVMKEITSLIEEERLLLVE